MNRYAAFAAMVLVLTGPADAALRWPVYDSDLLACDLIVVARIEAGTLKQRRRDADVKLIVAETLKGVAPGKIFDARVQCLVIVGGRYDLQGGGFINLAGGRTDYPKTRIVLYDDDDFGAGQDAPDLSQDAIWFLRKSPEGQGYVVGGPEYALPPGLKPFVTAAMSQKPEAELAKLLSGKEAQVKLRVLNYLMELHRVGDFAVIAPLWDDADEAVAACAAGAAAEVGDESALPAFRKALTHKNEAVRAAACGFLSRFGQADALPAIGEALRTLPPRRQQTPAANLWRMESAQAVPVLLELLGERQSAPLSGDPYVLSKAAAGSLRELTGIWFPLDASAARGVWEKFKSTPEEVLLRKAIQADIQDLTALDFDVRSSAYRRLGRLANQHFGSYPAFHNSSESGREESQGLWHKWAQANLTRGRLDWIYEGFAADGIDLPRPMDKKGIQTLIEVLAYYAESGQQGRDGTPKWKVQGRLQADFHVYNANLLLERFTGYKVGLSPYHYDLTKTWQRPLVLADRWRSWWAANGDKAALRPWPEEKPMTKEMLQAGAGADVLRPAVPIEVTIKVFRETFRKSEPVVIHVQVKNVSKQAVTIARRPAEISYISKSASGGAGCSEPIGKNKDEFVALAAGQTIEWDQDKAAFNSNAQAIQGFYYRLTYPHAGSQFGLNAWRGSAKSNELDYTVSE